MDVTTIPWDTIAASGGSNLLLLVLVLWYLAKQIIPKLFEEHQRDREEFKAATSALLEELKRQAKAHEALMLCSWQALAAAGVRVPSQTVQANTDGQAHNVHQGQG